MAKSSVVPLNFFLNEQHELSRGELAGGGRLPQLASINWAKKGQAIGSSLKRAKEVISASNDPLKESHYFLLASPESVVRKKSKDKAKAPSGVFDEPTDYASDHSRVFRRLGIDLLQVNADGTASVHVAPDKVEQFVRTANTLATEGEREQARWVTINSFDVIDASYRVDQTWLGKIPADKPTETIIELQPLLSRIEVDTLLRAIARKLDKDKKEKLVGTGSDFSGRAWVRGMLSRRSINSIAQAFYSVQSLHRPLLSIAAAIGGKSREKPAARPVKNPVNPRELPCVAILDAGIPGDHLALAPYRRGQFYDPNLSDRALGDHASFVASRIVFGDPDYSEGLAELPEGKCSYYDVMVSVRAPYIEDKSIVPAMTSVVGTAPDVRVFNLSFDCKVPLSALNEVERRERLTLIQDLDNFIFANDVIAVVAAGNSPPNTMPSQAYPQHLSDSQWELGHWSQSFNSITCGSLVERLSPNGVVKRIGWPSPFTKIGPGICESPKPDFAAHGGNLNDMYQFAPGCGVFGLNDTGKWEDRSGTSYAVPLLAREAAFAFRDLQSYCVVGSRPYAATVKAFLALTAKPTTDDAHVLELASRTMGRGKASADRILSPNDSSAVFIWQGVIEGPKDICRIQIPVPNAWRSAAGKPCLRICITWEAPVNAAANKLWASRKVNARLRASVGARALRSSTPSHESYTILEKVYDLNQKNTENADESWLLELSYEQIADYFPGHDFMPQQRVAFAAELVDWGDGSVSPQQAIQSLPAAATMIRLSAPSVAIQSPIILRTRI